MMDVKKIKGVSHIYLRGTLKGPEGLFIQADRLLNNSPHFTFV
jgi:hypothetical protein